MKMMMMMKKMMNKNVAMINLMMIIMMMMMNKRMDANCLVGARMILQFHKMQNQRFVFLMIV